MTQTTWQYWLDTMRTIVTPVLEAGSQGLLHARMAIEPSEDRAPFARLEAVGRTLCGIAPFLECPQEAPEAEAARQHLARLARETIAHCVCPGGRDACNFAEGGQPIVDAAFLCHALLRAPKALWHALDGQTQQNLLDCLRQTRTRKPHYNNWLLFGAMIETFLYRAGAPDWDPMRIDYALRSHMQWYLGDGVYGDGPDFHFDYYNSFVIQPMLVDIVDHVAPCAPDWQRMAPDIHARAARYAAVLERLIAPDGTYPPLGRSLAYRFGAFQHLAQMALQDRLPPALAPEQVRCALTAVIRRVMAGNPFRVYGFLRVGIIGSQPGLGESYICTGSLYLCSAVFLPLGLPQTHRFWQGADMPWTAVQVWQGDGVSADHAL